ncbi:MAG: hypothetical protein AAF346_02585 [Pseudomonadota bacterium]
MTGQMNPWKLTLMVALVSALLNGVITGVVGGWIAERYSTEQSRKDSVHALAIDIYDRRASASLVSSSIKRDAELTELRHRKERYDESYLTWNKNLKANLLRVREVLVAQEYSYFEQQIEYRLVKVLRRIDSCLTSAYDARIGGQDGKKILRDCEMTKQLQIALDCGYAITDELYKVARVSFLPWQQGQTTSMDSVAEQVDQFCPKR